ncbi:MULTISPECIES: ribosome maturation factor RimP [Lactobacillus]|uniref:ribosome maturation factor RimP n=1 Tax=Lactobacillus TaxID=1578 RepID=UPI000BEECA5B|nr:MULTISPECIES: ribosome maturation factor RimP [Lactobacillus]MBL1059066.1 ribosome maturation factor RimP [Lactobacillus sp. A27]MBM6958476.1 ribosome maturation factor RimP [Lactobacillus gallinarum]MBM6973138.1 ribosome maturation factor RimP [Lactobacillus gallinarum]MCC9272450.1 ribosome maturation factor RimP [Lactobacillus gallinarum]MDM8276247.1 ribosome maturation factor RimP [Lactobacillus gallinarum]
MSKVIDLVRPVVETIIDEHGDMLVDMEYVKEKGQNYLRIYVDRQPNGIDIDEIAALSELVSEKLDTIDPDPLPDPYVLELSSPGAERPIKTEADWERALNDYVHIGLYQKIEDKKVYEGTLKSYNNDEIVLEVKDKTRRKKLTIPRKLIAKIRFAIEF